MCDMPLTNHSHSHSPTTQLWQGLVKGLNALSTISAAAATTTTTTTTTK